MGLTDLKKELKKLDKDNLIELVMDLYKKNKSVQDYLDLHIKQDEQVLLKKYCDKVFEAFYPKRGHDYKLKDAKQALTDFKKLGASDAAYSELMLFFVETGVKFTRDFGDMNDAFYSSMSKAYLSALTIMEEEDLLGKFADRAGKVVTATRGMGWGFHDFLVSAYTEFYTKLP
jgi:hypothetical protein